ncbi:MAG: hypothetical protein QXI58_08110 [Candidatus Micrarchaeia archaeon]
MRDLIKQEQFEIEVLDRLQVELYLKRCENLWKAGVFFGIKKKFRTGRLRSSKRRASIFERPLQWCEIC